MLNKQDLARQNFQPKEFFESATATALKIDNQTNDQNILNNLMIVADKIQEIRNHLNLPVKISSAYRCLELNRAIKSKDTSQHPLGEAIDFQCKKFGSPEQIVKFIRDRKIVVDQCLIEEGAGKKWVHVSIKAKDNRNQFGKLINGQFTLLV